MSDADFSVKAIISAQTSQFEKGIKNAQSSVNSLSSSISNITNLVKKAFAFTGVAIGTKAIVDFGKSCVQSANQAVKTFNILDNTVRATGADAWTSIGKLESASKALSDSTNYSVTEIQKMQSVLLGFTNITGEAFDGASEAVLDMATVMGMDLTSAVQTVGKALDDPITGLDSLRRQGFKFTDEQKEELAQLVKNGKQFEAQKIILDTLAISYGGASKAGQDSFAKQRHSVENFSDTLGGKLIPVMQVFAENNSKMINSLTDVISKMDFTPVVNVITNLSKVFNTAFENISAYLKKGANEVSDFISRFNFKPIISVLDGLLGGLSEIISKFKEINSQKLDIFDKLKEALIDFSNSETFQNIVNFVNKIIDAVFFLWSEIQDIGTEIRDLVVDKIIEIWGKIKELFQNGQNALSESGQDIASWGDLFYDVLNNTFRSFQDLFGMIKALIHGDWAVAWEYAKLTVMRIADNILDIFSTIANAFPDLVNVFLKGWNWIIEQINKARKFFGQDPLDLAEAFESVDLSKKSGLEDKIKETENKIQELTGKAADITIQNLEGVSTKFAGFTQHALGEIGKLTEGAAANSEKQKQYFAGTFSSTEKDGGSTYEKFSEWDSKLLQQRLEDLDEWSDEYHEVQLALIEEEKKKAENADKTGAETEKINEYYNGLIEKENERSEKAKRNKVVETMKVVLSTISNIAKKTVEVFKKVVSTIKDVFSSITNIVKNIADAFSKLFEFNVDDALNSLLAIEDAILTFFVETLPKLPNFFEAAFTSVLTLIQTLVNSIDWGGVENILTSIVQTFTTYAPQILSGIVELFSNLVTSISNVLVENAPDIVSAIGQMFFTILEALPGLIENFLKVAGTYLSEIGKYITDNSERLSKDLSNIVESIVKGISNFIESGGWRNVLSALLTIQNAIQNAITDNLDEIVNVIIEALPDLVDMLIKSIVSASKAMEKVIKPIIRLVLAVIEAIIDVLLSDEVLDAGIEAGFAIMDAIFDELIPRLAKLIPKLIVKIISFIVKNLPKLVKAMVEGIIKSFTQVNWGQVIIDIFTGFIDAIKDLFGIHSPSTLFESFGTYMVEGLVAGLKGISESVMIILQPLVDLIKGLFDGLFNAITEPINNVVNAFTKLNEMGFETLKDTLKILVQMFTDLSNVTFTAITDLSKMGFDALNKSLDSVLGTLKDLTGLTFQSIVDLSKIGFDALKSVLTTVRDILKDINNVTFKTLEAGLNTIKDVVKIIADLITNITKISFDGFNNMFKGVADVVKVSGKSIIGVLGAVIQAIGDLWNEISDVVKNITTVKIWTPWQTYELGGVDLGKIELPDISKYTNIINALATGTNVAEKGLTLVGEAGPELVNFRGGEQVLNSHNTQKALEGMSGTTINQNVTFNNLQDTTAFAMLQQLKQYNRQMAINGII